MNIIPRRLKGLPRERPDALSTKLVAKRQGRAATEQPSGIPRTREAYDRTETVWGLIESQARAHPERTAIIDGETEIDYERLTQRASAIAGALVARGVEPGALVGVCMSRTWELVATLVGVLRAGCAYVPLDPAYPRERVRYMLEHARAAAAIVDHEHMAELCEGVPELVRLDEVGEWTAGGVAGVAGPGASDLTGPSASDLAYVIYTSGSTGRPKGVAVEHRNVVAMSRSMRELLDDEELAGVLAAASVCFDASVMEILGTLSLGGTVVLAENVLALLELPSADRVRSAIIVPSAMQALLAAGRPPEGIRCLAIGGEVLKRSLVDQLHALEPRPRVVNAYGPTEATVFSTLAEVPVGVETITIGKPVSSSRSYILNDSMQPVPVGLPGELYLAGDQLARGYLHDEELTKERFIEVDPNGPISEERLYRTGDLCRWREDGEIEFLGRVDQQVKIRGFRVELEEIESTLESMEGVDGAAAAVVDGGGGQKMLVSYVVSRGEAVTSEAARAYLAERLPKYMVPQVVMHLEELPRLPSGKLDRKQLPKAFVPHAGADVTGGAPSDVGVLAHRLAGLSKDERHAALLSIIRGEIASLLRFRDPEQVPPDHSLDDLGLDSLTAVELSSRLAATIGRKLPASALIDHPTPTAVADCLLDLMGSGATERTSKAKARGGASDTLGRFQAQIQSGHPPFLAAKAPTWSATDKGTLIRELRRRRDPYSKLVRTGSAHRGTVADVHTGEEREAIIWTTNLYLGLNRDPTVIEEAKSALDRFGTGMGTSPVASGVTDLHLEFEKAFAELVGKPAACLFSTGFTANLGVIAGVLGDNDLIVMDQLCHASIVDGARLCGATIRTFQHNDPSDLESILETEASPYRTTLVVLESVYSMGEGTAPVADIVHTAKKYGALVLVDEAHSFGFYGPRGAGLCAARGVTDQVDFIMTTLSKALGSLGGVIAAREEHIALLKSSARAFIFQATVSPADIAAALAALRRLSADDALRERLWDTTTYMRERFSEAGYDLGTGDGPIVTPHFSDSDKLYAIAHGLHERGVHTVAVTYPVVESGRGRLRFICSASHTREDVDTTLEALIDAERDADREAEEKRQASEDRHVPGAPGQRAGGGSSHVHPGRSGVEEWAHAFSAYLKETLPRAPGPTPNLAVSVGLPGNGGPITIVIDERDVTVGAHETHELHEIHEMGGTPFCSLRPTDDRAVSSLRSSDVQGLLDSVCRGACELHGQVEPFIWLIGRMADWSDSIRGRLPMLHRTATILLVALVGAGVLGCGGLSTTRPVPPARAGAGVPAAADDGAGVTFRDLTADEASGIDYRRVPSATNATFERIKAEPLYTMPLVVATPEKPRGSPGVALLDFDGDGDLDIYVTNGPGAANSLYANRLEETGALRFEDVAEAAGVAATDQDSTGVCFGDLDNDGDPDLVVLGRSEPNRLFENLGDGTFRDATAESGLGESDLGHTHCSVGDVDGDGLLDLAVANSYDWSRRTATLVEPWEENHPNQLFVNVGGLRFRDASVSSGIRDLTGFRPPQDGAATVTWAVVLVDYDQDGDLDLLQADDQGGLLEGPSRGLIQVLNNDGTGRFTAVTDRVGTDLPGTSWMGFAFADFDCDGHMDFFATNMGDYVFTAVGLPLTRGEMSSRAFLGTSDGGFVDAGPGRLRATPFGWSVMAPDLDNDGDPDVVFFGGLDGAIHTITADNPGAVLLNPGCSAHFEADFDALAVDHTRRNVHGGAVGDLNRDGFPDLVTVSAFDIPEEVPLKPYPVDYDSPFDATAWYVEAFSPAEGGAFVWKGIEFPDGGLAVEINDGNDNGWVEVRTLGTVGLLPDGRVNRDGIGAVIRVTPEGGRTTLRPVTGGSSFASQDALAQLFGLGRAKTATVEILWPGGTVHRLHDVRAGERIVFPEIPCDPRDPSLSRRKYRSCVAGALEVLQDRDLLSRSLAARFLASALRARAGSERRDVGR